MPPADRHDPRPWSPSSRQPLALQQTISTAVSNTAQYTCIGAPPAPLAPAAAAATATIRGPGFASLPLTRSPMAAGRPQAAGEAPTRSPAPALGGGGGAQPGGLLSPTRKRIGVAAGQPGPSNSHYPGLVLQSSRPSPRSLAAPLVPTGGVGPTDGVHLASNTANDADSFAHRALRPVSSRLHSWARSPEANRPRPPGRCAYRRGSRGSGDGCSRRGHCWSQASFRRRLVCRASRAVASDCSRW